MLHSTFLKGLDWWEMLELVPHIFMHATIRVVCIHNLIETDINLGTREKRVGELLGVVCESLRNPCCRIIGFNAGEYAPRR